MATYYFTANGFADKVHDFLVTLRWEDGTVTGTELARMLMADAVRTPFMSVSEANMNFSGDSMISNAYACKRLIDYLFDDVTFSDENLPPFPPLPPGVVG